MAKAKAKQEQATTGAGSGKATSARSLQKRKEEHLKKYLDDFEVQATAMLGKMGDVQDELTRKGVPITDGYEQGAQGGLPALFRALPHPFVCSGDLCRSRVSVQLHGSCGLCKKAVTAPRRPGMRCTEHRSCTCSGTEAAEDHLLAPKGVDLLPAVAVARLVDEKAAEQWLDEQKEEAGC
jgi:hypothetical protein